jgi:cytochrome c
MIIRAPIKGALIAALIVPLTGPADAQDSGDPVKGHAFARQYCSRCHAVEKEQAKSPVGEAPPFSTFAQYWPLEDLEESLAEGIMVGHEKYPMPVFQLGPEEIANLIAYLRTIQQPAKPQQAEPSAP